MRHSPAEAAAAAATAALEANSQPAPPRLLLRNLGVRFGGIDAVSNVSFMLAVGEILALIGPNGAGKTTIFNAISGLVPAQPHSVIAINGENVIGQGPEYRAQAGLARTFQIPRLFASLTVFENLKAVARVPAERLLRIAQSCNIAQRLEARPGELTLPEQKQVEIARALVTGGNVLLLDEIAAGVAPDEAQRLVRMVRGLVETLGISVIAIEHVMPVVQQLSERVIVLATGRVLAEGSLRELRENPDVVAAYFGKRRA